GGAPTEQARLMSLRLEPDRGGDQRGVLASTAALRAGGAAGGLPEAIGFAIPDLPGIDNLAVVMQRVDDLGPSLLHLNVLRLVPATDVFLRHPDEAPAVVVAAVDEVTAQQQQLRAQRIQQQQRLQQQRERAQRAQQAAM